MNEEEADYKVEQEAGAEAQHEYEVGEHIVCLRDNIKERLKELSNLREEVEKGNATLQTKREIWEAEHKKEIEELKDKKEIVEHIENLLRPLAIEEYTITREKQLTGGLGIRVMKKLQYEQDKALEWSLNHRLCLQLDKRAFESLAKTQKMDFVEIKEEITATIPKKIEVR